jgi:TetR/AcrR family transcriptional regulator
MKLSTVTTTTMEGENSPIKSPRWARRKESRPGEVLSAALDLFVEHGFASTRLEDVAARAGVSKGTLYLYFKNKEELFKAVVRESIVPLIEEFADEIKVSTQSNDDLLRRFFQEWWLRFGSTHLAGICKLIMSEAGNFPDLAVFFQQEVIEQNNHLLLSIVQRGLDAGEYKATNLDVAIHLWMAPLVLHTIWGNSVARCLPNTPVHDELYVAMHTEFVLASLKNPR